MSLHFPQAPFSVFATETGRDFLLETTIPGDFKTLEGIVWGLLTDLDEFALS